MFSYVFISLTQRRRGSILAAELWASLIILVSLCVAGIGVDSPLAGHWRLDCDNIKNILVKFYDEYTQTTPKKLKIVDAYLFYIMLTGIIQFVYCCLVGTFPFNSFLSGFISCVGSFVLGVCLRVQSNPANLSDFKGISPERAFADFIFASVILHLVVMNFIGWRNQSGLQTVNIVLADKKELVDFLTSTVTWYSEYLELNGIHVCIKYPIFLK